jgi:hypothetical protein
VFVDVHPALRTGGVAAIGQLDHQLARQTATAEKMGQVLSFHGCFSQKPLMWARLDGMGGIRYSIVIQKPLPS